MLFLGRLAPIFTQDFEARRQIAESLLSTLIGLISLTFERSKTAPIPLVIQLSVSLFGTVGLFVHWMVAYQNWTVVNTEQSGQFQELISYLVEFCLMSMTSSVRLLSKIIKSMANVWFLVKGNK